MPTQGEIEAVKQAHLAAITEVMSRYPPDGPVFIEEKGSVLISPFGPVARETAGLSNSRSGTSQPAPGSGENPEDAAEPGFAYSALALLAGLFLLIKYFRKLLE